jgi:hypothetical protein
MNSNKKSNAELYKILIFPAAFMCIMSLLNHEDSGVSYFFGAILVILTRWV